ncbi:Receptor-like protein 12 [Senna tora]|uniref:Receptor-like protein 12 n=1 Tax=Senna tora TaxID=362788 RepID=A0A834TR18_9FABA|nr:Receptor-like protein 12 [Senna tora]
MGLFWFLAMSMLYHLLFYSVFIFKVTNSFPSVHPVLCHKDESSALLQFKQNFVINKFASEYFPSHPKTLSWIPKTDCCSWDGVECDDQTGHVIGLDLSSSQLYGSIASNSSLFHLSQLQRLDLSGNHFNYSQIPSTLAHLSRLTHLDLSYSMFSGEIPKEISQLSKLLILDLCCNYVPSIPAINLLQLKQQSFIGFIRNMTNIQRFSLDFVSISSPIPNILTNLSSLQCLGLHSTRVYGEFPIGMFDLPNLKVLRVGLNQDLTGYLPASIGNLTSLEVLLLYQCRFSGSIPSSLGNLTQLQYLALSNKFHGEIPHSIFSLDNLRSLYLAGNLFEGQLELNSFINLKRIEYLYLSHINLSLLTKTSSSNASVPRNIRELLLVACNINEFPKLLKYQNQLEILWLSQNKMQGTLPSWIWRKKNLWILILSNNQLTGEISPMMCNLKSLEFIDLSFNNISGTIPPCLGTFGENLHTPKSINNKIPGIIPQEFMKVCSLKMIDFSQNNLQGQLPKALANCRLLEYLDVSNNQISDSFPFWLGTLPQLKVLILRSNKFSGVLISPRNSTFCKMHIIDLSQNDFSGKYPLELMQNWASMRASNVNDIKYEALYHYSEGFNGSKCEGDAAPTSATDEDSWFPFEFDWKVNVIGYGGGLVFGIAMGITYNWEKHALLWLIRVHRRVLRRY